MSIVKHFSTDLIKSEFGIKEKVEFWWFFMTRNIWNISDMDKVSVIWLNKYPLCFIIWNICKQSIEAVARTCSVEKVFLKTSLNS